MFKQATSKVCFPSFHCITDSHRGAQGKAEKQATPWRSVWGATEGQQRAEVEEGQFQSPRQFPEAP